MKDNDQIKKSFAEWKKRVNGQYIKAICKPCWEIKYCPYGSLVEYFPISKIGEAEGCRIFGHICPVYYVAEPFTETKELRNITRNIPTGVRRRVDRRDGLVCSICKRNIDDDEVNYDHIIPWSKGGPTDESNLRVVCASCNKQRSDSYEAEYLVSNALEWRYQSMKMSVDMVEDLLKLFQVVIVLITIKGELIESDFVGIISNGDSETESFMYSIVASILDLFSTDSFFIPVKKKESILKYRWGFEDHMLHNIEDVCEKYDVSEKYVAELEDLLLRQLGFTLELKKMDVEKYRNLHVDFGEVVESAMYKFQMMISNDDLGNHDHTDGNMIEESVGEGGNNTDN